MLLSPHNRTKQDQGRTSLVEGLCCDADQTTSSTQSEYVRFRLVVLVRHGQSHSGFRKLGRFEKSVVAFGVRCSSRFLLSLVFSCFRPTKTGKIPKNSGTGTGYRVRNIPPHVALQLECVPKLPSKQMHND